MANIVITTNTNRLYAVFNDMTSLAGMPSGDWQKSSISLVMNLGNIDVFFTVTGEQQFRLSYNGSTGSMQVDSVNGTTPVSNADLLSLLQTATASQVITVSATAPVNPNVNDLWVDIS